MEARLMPYKVLAYGLSDIGLVRQNNEDVWGQLPEFGFFVLADGMGGHQAGEIAAREAVNVLCRAIKKKIGAEDGMPSLLETEELVRRAIVHVNSHVFKMSRSNPDLKGMGTTLCCLLFHQEGLIFAHVGDSRIYRLRGKKLVQMTKDHSLLSELLDLGELNEQQATEFLYKNIITKAVGTEPKLEPTVEASDLAANDIYLMCSDGLSDLLTPQEIEAILNKSRTMQIAAETLVDTANIKGGRDNITVVISKVEGTNEREDLPR